MLLDECVNSNTKLQHQTPTNTGTDVPIPINLGQGVHLSTVVGICGGGRHSLAVLCNDRGVHEIHAFGRGDDGQLGLSDISSQKQIGRAHV